jgi:predicted NodU family carbamoyl transferase
MDILAINTSHDTSIVTAKDGIITNVWEEERHRRSKYWSPKPSDCNLLTLVQRGVSQPDHLIFASFDRRVLRVEFSNEVREDRLLQRDIANAFAHEQVTMSRLRDIEEEFNKDQERKRIFINHDKEGDNEINKVISEQLESKEFVFDETKHHLYHAESGYYFSPWYKDDEPAIAITWDGGGAQPNYKQYPNYQEIESIYFCEGKTKQPKLQWQRLSNHRALGEWKAHGFQNMLENCLDCPDDAEVTIEGVPTVLTSAPSCGMNFSNLSYALGCDAEGRAAGKVMGMASYAEQPPRDNVFTRHTVAQQCELESLEHSVKVIQRALDLNPNCNRIVLSGGFSLNCTNNYKYMERFPEVDFFVDPVPHDGGTAIGAALWLHRELSS